MWNQVILEWAKFKSNVVFRVLVIMYLALLPLKLITGNELKEFTPPFMSEPRFFEFPDIFNYLGYIGNWLVFFSLGFFAVFFITSEYHNKTLRQNIITGVSRKNFYYGKIGFLFMISFGATLYYWILSMVFGYINTDPLEWSMIAEGLEMVPRYFLMTFGYCVFGAFLGFIVRKSGIAIFVYFTWAMFIEVLIRWGLHYRYILKNKSMHFYPLNAMEDLVPIPFDDITRQMMNEMNIAVFLSPGEAIITTIVYIALFLSVAYWYFIKADL